MEYLTTRQAADLFGLKNDSSIRQAIRRGRLKAEKFGHIWQIEKAELERWRNEERHISAKNEDSLLTTVTRS